MHNRYLDSLRIWSKSKHKNPYIIWWTIHLKRSRSFGRNIAGTQINVSHFIQRIKCILLGFAPFPRTGILQYTRPYLLFFCTLATFSEKSYMGSRLSPRADVRKLLKIHIMIKSKRFHQIFAFYLLQIYSRQTRKIHDRKSRWTTINDLSFFAWAWSTSLLSQ